MSRSTSAVAVLLALLAGCQGWDRIERPPSDAGPGGADREAATGLPDPSPPGVRRPLTAAVAERRLAQIRGATGAERLGLAAQFVADYPEADAIAELHVLLGDAHLALGEPAAAAAALERAAALSDGDLLGLPHEAEAARELGSRLGWAHYLAGDRDRALWWWLRTTWVTDEPGLLETLRYVHAEAGEAAEGFEAWLRELRRRHGVVAPDFELPGYQSRTVELRALLGRVTILCFWSPT